METFVEPAERLFVPHRKRLSHSYAVNEDGARELRIYYGVKEIVFDDERYFAFGEQLVAEPSFTGERATTWGPGYAWDELRPFLETLVEEGILERGDAVDEPRSGGLVPSPLPPAVCTAPRWWSDTACEAITRELANRAVEIGYLETFLPVYRVAHPALDADGRQVGEANVVPPPFRLDRDTEWRACQYPGSRFRDDAPMNVTALKAMIKHWKPMMAALLQVRAALRDRLGPSRGPSPESWTVGELHVLACVVLALPAYQLLKHRGSSPPALHPVLSSLFRITDGIRMVSSSMLLSAGRPGDEPATADEVHAYAEQHGLLLSAKGVCAGPRHLIDEFLRTAVDGVPAEGIADLALPAEVGELLSELPAGLDYGLGGFQVWGLAFSVWLAMSRVQQELLAILEAMVADERCARLHARLRADLAPLQRLEIVLENDRALHRDTYADAYERSRRGSRTPLGPPTLAQAVAPVPEAESHRAAAAQLRGLLGARLSRVERAPEVDRGVDRLVDALLHYLREEQAILAVTTQVQAAINRLLDRPPPTRELAVRDLHVIYSVLESLGSFPYLLDTLEDELGIHVECTAHTLEISDRRPASSAP